jgi:formylglycine-generating enzyme required for sulfatase activity
MAALYVTACALLGLALLCSWLWVRWHRWWFDAAEARRRQAAAARRLGVPVEKSIDLGGGVNLELALIPAGWFEMGSPEDEAGRSLTDAPLHHVRISRPFYMGRYEVTQEVWKQVMGSNPSYCRNPRHPVEQVFWADCQDFLARLNTLVKDGGGFRLPTEAEWEWACRAGTRTRFSFGDDERRLGDYAWCSENSGGVTHPVGEKLPNAWGLHDMHGNVQEWCADWFDTFLSGTGPSVPHWRIDPQGPSAGGGRVIRSSAWGTIDPGFYRSAVRDCWDPARCSKSLGFRVVLAISGQQAGATPPEPRRGPEPQERKDR